MNAIIKAKPTTYKGIRFRSKMEAQFAVACDLADVLWDYEPKAHKATDWKPDFAIMSWGGFGKLLLELKPKEPTFEYMEWWKCGAYLALLDETVTASLLILRSEDYFLNLSEGVDWIPFRSDIVRDHLTMNEHVCILNSFFNDLQKIVRFWHTDAKHYRFDLKGVE